MTNKDKTGLGHIFKTLSMMVKYLGEGVSFPLLVGFESILFLDFSKLGKIITIK